MAHWLWLSSTAWLKVPSSSRLREDPIERGKLRSVNLLHRTRARPDSIHVRADRCRDHPEEFISQPHRWPYFFHHNGPVSRATVIAATFKRNLSIPDWIAELSRSANLTTILTERAGSAPAAVAPCQRSSATKVHTLAGASLASAFRPGQHGGDILWSSGRR